MADVEAVELASAEGVADCCAADGALSVVAPEVAGAELSSPGRMKKEMRNE